MQFWKAVISSVIACLFSVNSALAFETVTKNTASEFVKTLPPVGFVKFCVTNPADCKTRNVGHGRIAMPRNAGTSSTSSTAT